MGSQKLANSRGDEDAVLVQVVLGVGSTRVGVCRMGVLGLECEMCVSVGEIIALVLTPTHLLPLVLFSLPLPQRVQLEGGIIIFRTNVPQTLVSPLFPPSLLSSSYLFSPLFYLLHRHKYQFSSFLDVNSWFLRRQMQFLGSLGTPTTLTGLQGGLLGVSLWLLLVVHPLLGLEQVLFFFLFVC